MYIYFGDVAILSNTEWQEVDPASAGELRDLTPVDRLRRAAKPTTACTRGVQCKDTITNTVKSIDIFIKMHVQYVIITYFKLRKTIYTLA